MAPETDAIDARIRTVGRRLRMIAVAAVTLAITFANVPGFEAQERPSPKFEVASVKPSQSGNQSVFVFRNGRFNARYTTLKRLIRIAYGTVNGLLMENHLEGGPNWLDVDRFDVEAIAPGMPDLPDGSIPETARLMLRNLLIERFSLMAHFETRDRPLFALVLARRDGTLGPGFQRRKVDCIPNPRFPAPKTDDKTCHAVGAPGVMSASGVAMPALVNALSQSVPEIDRKVVDRTGLTGTFDIELRWTPDTATSGAARGATETKYPSIFVALQEQLGLKLEPTTGPIEMLVIDSLARPTPD